MRKIFFTIVALCLMATSAMAYDPATNGTYYTGSGYEVIGLANGKVAVTGAWIDAESTEVIIPASVNATWNKGTSTSCDYTFEVEQVGNGTALYVERSSSSFLTSVVTVRIDEGVQKVAQSAFWGASALQYLTLPASLTEIGAYAFQQCDALEGIWYNSEATAPVALPTLGEKAFEGNASWDKIYNNCIVYVLNKDVKDAMEDAGANWQWRSFTKQYHSFALYDDYYQDKTYYNGKYVNVRTNRTFTAGQWHTICFPFSIDNWNLKNVFGESVELAYLSSSSLVGDDLTLNFGTDATYTTACTPYLIKPSQDVAADAEFQGVWYSEALSKKAHTANANFIGSFAPITLTADQYFMGNDNNLYTNAGVTMNGFRAYFEFGESVPAGVMARIVMRDQVVTTIENVNAKAQATKMIENGQLFIIRDGVKYNAQGQIMK